MLTFDNFKAVFTKGKKPYWILYKGNMKGNQIGSWLGEDDADTEIEDSLRRLEDIILLYGDGIYTVDCRSAKTSSRGNDTHTFMYGDAAPKAVSGTVAAPAQHPAAGFFQGLDARYFLEQNSSLQAQVFAAQMEALRKDLVIQQLKQDAKLAGQQDAGPSIAGFLQQNPGIVKDLIGIVSGAVPQPAQRVGVLKPTQPIPAQDQTADVEESDQEEYEDYEQGKIDLNALFEAALRIQRALPGRHVNDIIDSLAQFTEDQPEQAENLLDMLPK